MSFFLFIYLLIFLLLLLVYILLFELSASLKITPKEFLLLNERSLLQLVYDCHQCSSRLPQIKGWYSTTPSGFLSPFVLEAVNLIPSWLKSGRRHLASLPSDFTAFSTILPLDLIRQKHYFLFVLSHFRSSGVDEPRRVERKQRDRG